jgi:hypothetical protein
MRTDQLGGFFIFMFSIAIVLWLIRLLIKAQTKEWLKYPSLNEYWDKYPNCNTKDGTRCFNCDSNKLKIESLPNLGGNNDELVAHCTQCSTKLYRVKKER